MVQPAQTASKSQFAQLCGVTPGRVTQWISEGKLDGNALNGEGRAAHINVEIANAQLKQRLDVNQRFGMNGLHTNLSLKDEAYEPVDAIEERIKQEKLRQAEFTTRRLERADREALGYYMKTSEARAEMTRLASMMMAQFEGALAEFAGSLSAKFDLVNRDVLHLLREEFRKVRVRSAQSFQEQAQTEAQYKVEASA